LVGVGAEEGQQIPGHVTLTNFTKGASLNQYSGQMNNRRCFIILNIRKTFSGLTESRRSLDINGVDNFLFRISAWKAGWWNYWFSAVLASAAETELQSYDAE
jgi:hypothetical protein